MEQTIMSGGIYCTCKTIDPLVTMRRANCSAFNGYRRTPSAYSQVICVGCGAIGRTKAAYVSRTMDAPEGWHSMPVAKLRAWKRQQEKAS
jgi:ornithine cyclodeaminase/alanine dehydrogenase-like protein (mu-crystallin family)